MARQNQYELGTSFPHEGFVQQGIEAHFRARGFEILPGGNTDLLCRNPELGETWVIEAKGETSGTGLDFRTGLGQLLQQMDSSEYVYAIAVPATSQFLSQCKKLSAWVRLALKLHIILVQEDGRVHILRPEDALSLENEG
jgi:hypothetical protein